MKDNLTILPLGSVVALKEGNGVLVMIVSRGILTEKDGEKGYYDYGAVLAPAGLVSPDNILMFNRENIQEVYFVGYRDSNEQAFEKEYDKIVSQQKYSKLSV